MLADSGLLPQLQLYSRSPLGNPLCIYGDLGYPLRPQLQTSFRGLHLTPLQQHFNTTMSSVRASVEWVFGDITNYFSFLDFKKKLKLGLSAVGKMYIVCALLTNARSFLYPTSTSIFFNLGAPTLQGYFSKEGTRVYMYRTVYFVYAPYVKTKHSHCSDLFSCFVSFAVLTKKIKHDCQVQ